jgi:PAS domain S-box-containing protein
MKKNDASPGEASSESEAHFQAVWQAASDAMVLSNADGTVFAANPAYYSLYGYQPEEVLGKDFSIIFPSEQREWARKLYTYIFQGPAIHSSSEATILRADGSERYVEARYSFITQNDTRTAMLSIIRDITERKRAEEALRDSKLKLHLALELAHMGTWEWDIASNKIDWSTNLEIALGFAPGTFSGRFEDFLRVIHPEDKDRVEREIRRTLVEGTDYQIEFRSLGADGAVYWSANRGQVIYDDEGKPARMIGVSMAIPASRRTTSTE